MANPDGPPDIPLDALALQMALARAPGPPPAQRAIRPPSTRNARWVERQEARLTRHLLKNRHLDKLVEDLRDITDKLSEAKKTIDKTQEAIGANREAWARVGTWTDTSMGRSIRTRGLLMGKMNDVTGAANEVQHSIANLRRSLWQRAKILSDPEMQESRSSIDHHPQNGV